MRGRRTASLAQRTKRSIEVRGVKGTVERIEQEIRRPKPTPTVTAAPELTADYRPLAFPAVANPQVSVVIPVHNHYHHTYACLKSLLETTVAASFEVVVVDDASSDETVTELPRIEGITHLQNVENLGFVGTCNRGAEASRGEYVVFLNNDTAVADGWLDALLETFETHPDAGLVGAKLVYPDGRLQEAGGIVFADGSGWNYGRFEDPDHPAYNFVREVDYCSGAAIMIRRELFQELGCFDQRYAPAYYEDTDLAFAVRDHGLKVYYQPASVVTHFEGITSGTDTSSGTKRYQVINQAKFLEKWAGALARQNPPGTSILRAREHGRMRRALIIDACTPEPDKDSGSVRMVHIMEILRELGYQVSFFADNRAWVEGYTADLQRLGVEAWHHPWIDHSPKFFEDAGDSFDVVILSRYYVATNYIELLRRHCRGARLLFDTVDLHFLRERRLAELEDDEKLAETATKTREQELGVAARCDVTLVVSPYEQTFLAEEAPDLDVAVVSNIHRVHGRRRTWADRANILFVGGYQHPPNIDAVQWFATEIFPHVRRELHDVVFHIVGSKATPDVRRLGDLDGVEFHGFVEDIEPFLDGCRIAVAPLRYGAGVKGKVNSSMSYGQPVVATTPAVEGMFVRPGEDVLVADEPEAFASQVVRAYRDEGVWNRLSDGGLENVQRYFSFEAAREAIRAAITSR
ncbi:MAG: glycosyltransferase [Pseudomonadota bacterium]